MCWKMLEDAGLELPIDNATNAKPKDPEYTAAMAATRRVLGIKNRGNRMRFAGVVSEVGGFFGRLRSMI